MSYIRAELAAASLILRCVFCSNIDLFLSSLGGMLNCRGHKSTSRSCGRLAPCTRRVSAKHRKKVNYLNPGSCTFDGLSLSSLYGMFVTHCKSIKIHTNFFFFLLPSFHRDCFRGVVSPLGILRSPSAVNKRYTVQQWLIFRVEISSLTSNIARIIGCPCLSAVVKCPHKR